MRISCEMARGQSHKWMVGVREVEVTQAGDGDKDGVSGELTHSEKEKEVKMSYVTGIERKLMNDYKKGEAR